AAVPRDDGPRRSSMSKAGAVRMNSHLQSAELRRAEFIRPRRWRSRQLPGSECTLGKNNSFHDAGAFFIAPMLCMNDAYLRTFSGVMVKRYSGFPSIRVSSSVVRRFSPDIAR